MIRQLIELFFLNFSPTCYRLVKLVLVVSALGITLLPLPTYSLCFTDFLIQIKFDNDIIFKVCFSLPLLNRIDTVRAKAFTPISLFRLFFWALFFLSFYSLQRPKIVSPIFCALMKTSLLL